VTDSLFNAIASRVKDYRQDVFDPVLELAIEIAREGREGRRIGTLLTIGQADAVMASSRPLILDPLSCHPPQLRRITDPGLRGTLKELAQLDGAFVLSDDGIVVSESSVVRLFDRGTLAADILPELWLLSRYHTQLRVKSTPSRCRIQVREGQETPGEEP
jgi:diadenylate cyclase